MIVSFKCPAKMNALLAVRSRLPVTSVSLKGLASVQPYSQRVGKESGNILPLDPGVKPFSAIPGPPSLPIIGTLLDYYRGKYSLQRPYATYSEFLENYGSLVKEKLFYGQTLVHVFDPKDFQTIYMSEKNRLPIRHSHKALEKYRESRKDLYGHVGLPPSNGEEWYSYRKLFEPLLVKDLDLLQRGLETIADDLIEYMKSNLDHNGEISLFPTLYYYTLECLGLLVLGKRMGCFNQDRGADVTRLIQAVHESHYAIHETELKPYLLARKAYKTLEISQDYIANFVLKQMNSIYDLMELESIRNTDPLDETATIKDLGTDADNSLPVRSFLYQKLKRGMTKHVILPMAVDLFQGGIHSTAHSLAFAMYHLALNPDKQEILRKELLENLPNKTDSCIRVPGLNSERGYLMSTTKESLRLNPPTIGTGRVLVEDLVLSGYHVPKGTKVIIHHEVASKHKDYFPDPLKFIPGRKMFSHASNPFIAHSRRKCLGIQFAIIQMRLAKIKVFRNFEVSYHYKEVGVVNYLINEPDQPIKLRLKEIPDDVPTQEGTTQSHLNKESDKSV